MSEKKLSEALDEAAEAHTNLNMYAAIVALCESGCFSGAPPAVQRIVRICIREQQKCLTDYDKASAAIAERSRTP